MTTALARAQYVADLLNRQGALYRSRNWLDDAPYFKYAPSFAQFIREHYGPCPSYRPAFVEAWGELIATVIPLTNGLCLMQTDGPWFACNDTSAAIVAQSLGASETFLDAV